MSEIEPAIERAGIPTPKNLAHPLQEGNTPALSAPHDATTITADRFGVEIRLAMILEREERTLIMAETLLKSLGDESQTARTIADWLVEIYVAVGPLAEVCGVLGVDYSKLRVRT